MSETTRMRCFKSWEVGGRLLYKKVMSHQQNKDIPLLGFNKHPAILGQQHQPPPLVVADFKLAALRATSLWTSNEDGDVSFWKKITLQNYIIIHVGIYTSKLWTPQICWFPSIHQAFPVHLGAPEFPNVETYRINVGWTPSRNLFWEHNSWQVPNVGSWKQDYRRLLPIIA